MGLHLLWEPAGITVDQAVGQHSDGKVIARHREGLKRTVLVQGLTVIKSHYILATLTSMDMTYLLLYECTPTGHVLRMRNAYRLYLC